MRDMKKKIAAVSVLVAGSMVLGMGQNVYAQNMYAYSEQEAAVDSQVIANDESGIPDKAFYEAALWDADSDKDGVLTVEEAKQCTVLDCLTKVESIQGINYFPNLIKLYIQESDIHDFSPLEEVTKLCSLGLPKANLSDISVLKNLTQLSQLYLSDNNISDISILKDCTKLSVLGLSNNNISDISVLKDLTKLEDLNLSNNNISDISVLKDLTELEDLSLSNNNISDISVLKDLTKLEDLSLSNNNISDISVLKNFIELQDLNLLDNNISDISMLKDCTKLIFLGLSNNNISDIGVLKDLTKLRNLSLSNNRVSDISALKDFTGLEYLNLSNNSIGDISVLKDFTGLEDLNLSNNRVSDISVLEKATKLQLLWLSHNNIEDITPLKDLEISMLDLCYNQISDISMLEESILLKHIGSGFAGKYYDSGILEKFYNIAEGNQITVEQAKAIIPEELWNAPIIWGPFQKKSGETGATWSDTEPFVDSTKNGAVQTKLGEWQYWDNGVYETDYTGMTADASTGSRYWFDSGIAARDKQVYSLEDNAWYWFDADGSMAVDKEVYIPESNENRENGKWVRYNGNGHMVKGWYTTEDGKTYHYDENTGEMAHGAASIDGVEYAFDDITGVALNLAWYTIDGNEYWYENGVRQGYDADDSSYRGKEIYDPESDAWYWLDNREGGKKAVSKDVYQESYAGEFAEYEDGTGKWVRYDKNGYMVKGWDTKDGSTYYFDEQTGAMAHGMVEIDGSTYTFDSVTGVLQETGQ